MSNLGDSIAEAVRAGFSGILVNSFEHEEADRIIEKTCKDFSWDVAHWDAARGLRIGTEMINSEGAGSISRPDEETRSPMMAIEKVNEYDHRRTDTNLVVTMTNLQLALLRPDGGVMNPMLMQLLLNSIWVGKGERRHFVLLAVEGTVLPPEIEKHFLIIRHDLPVRDELYEIAVSLQNDETKKLLPKRASETMRSVLDAASGLTGLEAEGAMCLSMARHHGDIRTDTMWDLKEQFLKKAGLLELSKSKDGFDMIGGLQPVKEFCVKAFQSTTRTSRVRPRGIVLLGVPGCLHADTPVLDPVDGTVKTVKDRWLREQAFHVWSRDDAGKSVVAMAEAPVKYPAADMLTFTSEDGRSITVTHGHLFWNGRSYVTASSVADEILRCGVFRLPTSLDIDRTVRPQDVYHCLNRASGSRVDCRSGLGSGDERLPWDEEIYQGCLPSPADAQLRNRGDCIEDGMVVSARHTPLSGCDLQTMPDSCLRSQTCSTDGPLPLPARGSDPRGPGSTPDVSKFVSESGPADRDGRLSDVVQASSLVARYEASVDVCGAACSPHSESDSGARLSVSESGRVDRVGTLHRTGSSRGLHRGTYGHTEQSSNWIRLVKVKSHAAEPYYDFHVPKYENYWACGMWHHNTGKSAFAKALGVEVGLPTVALDFGRLMAGLVGQTEGQTRRALAQLDAMDNCIAFIDEIEKALAGTGGGEHDSGVGSRMLGSFLTWMNDHTSNVFVICTCNDVSKLPPELLRAERFDGIFFMDLPGREQRKIIWDIYLKYFEISSEVAKAGLPDDSGWTGAEIRTCCRLAKLFDSPLKDAAEKIVPVAVTNKEKIDKLRQWAKDRCLSADVPGVYRPERIALANKTAGQSTSETRKRRVVSTGR